MIRLIGDLVFPFILWLIAFGLLPNRLHKRTHHLPKDVMDKYAGKRLL